MITEEQIKNLKPGDPLIIRGTYVRKSDDGDIIVCVKMADNTRNKIIDSNKYINRSCIFLPPEYDYYRLFKRGDIVRYVERGGRSYVDAPPVGTTCRVIVGEDGEGMVIVEFKFSENEEPAVHNVPFYHLVLITPVEEFNPYSVLETDTINGFDIMRDGLCVMTFPYGSKEAGYYRNELTAKEAAEYECARLNAEWREKQNL